MAVKKPESESFTDENLESEVQEAFGEDMESNFDIKLHEWLEQQNLDSFPSVYLYKFDNPKSGNDKELVFKYEDNIPDAHEVGLTFGSGRYLIMVSIPSTKTKKGGVKGFRFRINAHYDKLMMQQQGANAQNGNPYPPSYFPQNNNQKSGVNEGLVLVKEVMAMIMPLFAMQARQNNNQGNNSPDISKLLMGTYGGMNEVLKENMIQTTKLIADVQRSKLEQITSEPENDDYDNEESEKTMLEKFLPMIEQFLPLLTGNSIASKTTIAAVKAAPEFKKIISNQSELKNLISFLDAEKGKEVTDKILTKFKIKRV